MSGQKIDGRAYAAGLRDNIAKAVSALPAPPTLAVVLVGEDPASEVYVANKAKFTIETGMRSLKHALAAAAPLYANRLCYAGQRSTG